LNYTHLLTNYTVVFFIRSLNELSLQYASSQEQLKIVAHTVDTMKTKASEYMERIQQYKDKLQQDGFDKRLSHAEIKQVFDELQVLKAELAQKEGKLQIYRDLPPVCLLFYLNLVNVTNTVNILTGCGSCKVNN